MIDDEPTPLFKNPVINLFYFDLFDSESFMHTFVGFNLFLFHVIRYANLMTYQNKA